MVTCGRERERERERKRERERGGRIERIEKGEDGGWREEREIIYE